MNATVHSPWALLLIPLLFAVVLLVARRSLAGLEPLRRRLAICTRLLVVLLLLLGLAEIDVLGLAERVSVVVAVDRSRSIPEQRAQESERMLQALAERAGARDTLRLVLFGRTAQHEGAVRAGAGPERMSALALLDRDGTDIEAGLTRAIDSVDADARGRVLLLTDGNATTGEVRAALARARQQGVAVDVVPLSYSHHSEVVVEKLSVPPRAAVGEPYRARVVIESTTATPALLRVWRDGALVETRRVQLSEGATVEEVQLANDRPGFSRIEASVEPLDRSADTLPQNNVAYGFVHTPGRSMVLYVSHELEQGRPIPLVDAWREAGFVVTTVRPGEVPLDQGAYQDVDAIVLDGPPRREFSERQLSAIEAAVAHLGVGLIMLGGPDSFGAGDWGRTPVEDALPVDMEPRTINVVLSTALVLVIDHSGSMAGEKLEMAKAAAVAAGQALTSSDRVGVVAFDDSATWVVRLRPAFDPSGLRARVQPLTSGGGTVIATGLREAFAALRGCPDAAVKHVIALTDGRSEAGDELQQAMRARSHGITLTCVGVGQDADDEHLRLLARAGGGRYYDVDVPRDLPRIFVKETQRVARPLVREETFVPAVHGSSPILGSLDSFPELRGLVLTEPKGRAEMVLTGPEGAPVFACWQYGLGRSIAFTSDTRPVWAPEWVAWDGYTAFWTQALRWVARDLETATLTVTTRLDGGTGRVLVDAVDGAGELVNGLTIRAHVRSPDGKTDSTQTLAQAGAGRYEGGFPVEAGRGTYEVTLTSAGPSGRREAVTTGLVVPWSEEYRRLRSNDDGLAEIARACDGHVVPIWDLIEGRVDPWDTHDLPERRSHKETWPIALAAAVFLFLLDVAVRRVSLPPRKPIVPEAPRAAPAERLAALRAAQEARREPEAIQPARAHEDVVGAPTPATSAPVSASQPPTSPALPASQDGSPTGGPSTSPSASVTERLLEAKRRAGRGRG